MPKILVVGNPFADRFRATTDDELIRLGLEKGDTAIVGKEVVEKTYSELTGVLDGHQIHLGGSGCNVAKGLAFLFPHNVNDPTIIKLLGRVGNDAIGKEITETIKRMGITSLLRESEQPTGVVNCLVNPLDAQRTMQAYLGAANDFCLNDIYGAGYHQLDFVHIEGYNVLYGDNEKNYTLEELVNFAKRAKSNVKIALDLAGAHIASSNRERLLGVIKKVDIVFGNLSEYLALFGEDIKNPSDGDIKLTDKFYSSFRQDQIIVVTKGMEGSEVKNRGMATAVHFNAEVVNNVKDTTGAGDNYDAGFIYGYLMGLSIEKCVRIATRMASEIITVLGADFSDEQKDKLIAEVKEIAAEGEVSRFIESSTDDSISHLTIQPSSL